MNMEIKARDLIAAGLSSSNSVAQINQAVLYALDGEILVNATDMDFTRLNAVAAGHAKVDYISGTMVLTNDVTVLDDLLANAAAGNGSTVNVDAAGMGPAKLTALSVNIAKVDSITNLTVTNAQTDVEITNLLTKATGALATATDMNPAKLSALGGGAGSIAANGITGSLVVSAAVNNQSALFGKVAPADGSFVTIDAAYTVTDAESIIAYGDLKNSWSDAAIFDKVDEISNLALYTTEEAAQITALLGKSVASGAGMATAVATSMTVDMINAIAAEAALAKIKADGVSGTMSVTSLVNNLDNLLAKTNVEASALTERACSAARSPRSTRSGTSASTPTRMRPRSATSSARRSAPRRRARNWLWLMPAAWVRLRSPRSAWARARSRQTASPAPS